MDSATKHLVSCVRQYLDVHKNKRICQKMEWITHSSEYDLGWHADVDNFWGIREHDKCLVLCQDGGGRYQAPRGEALCKSLTLNSDTVSISGDMLILGVFTSNFIYLQQIDNSNCCLTFWMLLNIWKDGQGQFDNDEWFVLFCASFTLPGWWWALPSTSWWGNHILHAFQYTRTSTSLESTRKGM